LPKPKLADTASTTTSSGQPVRFWFTVAPIVLALLALVAMALPGITDKYHGNDPQSGSFDHDHSRSIFRIFIPAQQTPSAKAGLIAFLFLVAACLLTALATIPLRRTIMVLVLRWCAYPAVPLAIAALVYLVRRHYHILFSGTHGSETFNDGSSASWGTSIGVGLWLFYATFVALYALFVWREVLLVRQRRQQQAA